MPTIKFQQTAKYLFLVKKVFKIFLQTSQENACAGASSLIMLQAPACNFIKKETSAQVFSCEFHKIF